MNIYKRQMESLGIDLEKYSKILDVPEKITKKIINGNGEVTKDMEINNFLRKNLFERHQEIEKNKEEKQMEALNLKIIHGENSDDAKKQWLLENYPNSKEVQWYVNEYDKATYFTKYNIKNRTDLMNRYKFNCNTGKLKGLNEVGISTIERLTEKKYDQLGIKTAYPLICQLYDCLALGNIKERQFENKDKLKEWFMNFDMDNFIKENSMSYMELAEKIGVNYKSIYSAKTKKYIPSNQIIQKIKNIVDSKDLNEMQVWFNNFDFREFCNKNEIPTSQMAFDLKVSNSTIKAIKNKKYKPSMTLINRLYDYVNNYDNSNVEIETVTTGQTKAFNETINNEDIMKVDYGFITTAPFKENLETMQPIQTQEDLLRNLLKDRLTEEEKVLIQIFGGKL